MNSTQPDIPALRRELLADLQAVVQIGELTVEDFGPLHARYARLRTLGVEFAPEFVLLMALLERQAMHTDDDPDSDRCVDAGQENDQENEDDEQFSSTPCDVQILYRGTAIHRSSIEHFSQTLAFKNGFPSRR